MKRWMVLFLLIAVSGSAVLYWLTGFGRPSKEDSASVRLATVSRRDMGSFVQATGVVKPQVGAEVRVGARISGRVECLCVSVGQRVKKGEVIVRLEREELEARVRRAEADLAYAQANLELIRRGSREQEIRQVQQEVREAEAVLQFDLAELERKEKLFSQGFVSWEELERARREAEVARAHLQATRERLRLIEDRYTPEEIAMGHWRVEQARALLREAQVQLGYATIAAPISGIIAQVSTQKGETVAAGLQAPTFITIVDLDRLEVDAYVDEVDIGRVKVGQKATFTVDSYPGREFEGEVTAIYPKAILLDNVVNYVTVISVGDHGGLLKPDMTASVRIFLGKKKGVLALPREAVKREGRLKVVYVWHGGRAEKREVVTGWRDGDFLEIESGLKEGEQVLLEPPSPEEGGR
jgi:multidrug efflux pump subunit AcrA (membrane-fusion protein)